jgi:ankyrin repeat protein
MRILVAVLALVLGLSGLAKAQIDEPVMEALRAGDAAALAEAFAAGADPEARFADGLEATTLMYAASNPDPALVRAVLAAGAAVDTPDAMGDPAINWAAYYGHAAVVAVLVEAGASTQLTGHGNALEIAMRRGHAPTLAVLADAAGTAPARPARESALEAAILAGDEAAFATLLDLVDAASARDWAGRPLLQSAAREGRADMITALIAAGADVDATDAIGFTALFEAARDGQLEAVDALLAAGADVDHHSHARGLSLTPLHLAAIGGDAAIVTRLAEAGADLDVQGATGATPLYWAAFENRHDAVVALLDAGADPTVQPEGTPDFAAVADMMDWPDIAERLRN